jgi:hypothetical protein
MSSPYSCGVISPLPKRLAHNTYAGVVLSCDPVKVVSPWKLRVICWHVSVGQTILQTVCSSDSSRRLYALRAGFAVSMPELLDYAVKVN